MRLTNILSYSILPSLLLTAACGGDGGGEPAKFSSATEAQRQRAVIAGAGLDAAFGTLVASFATVPREPGNTCPTVVQDGLTYTATFNCTDSDGVRTDGVVSAYNAPSIFGGGSESDPTKDAVFTFEGFRQHGPTAAGDLAFDGTITMRVDQHMVVALEAQLNGISVYTDATYLPATDEGMASAAAGSTIDIDGLGTATIGGSWNSSTDTPAGALELQGAELLRADFGATAEGCVPLTIDGAAAGELCQEQ